MSTYLWIQVSLFFQYCRSSTQLLCNIHVSDPLQDPCLRLCLRNLQDPCRSRSLSNVSPEAEPEPEPEVEPVRQRAEYSLIDRVLVFFCVSPVTTSNVNTAYVPLSQSMSKPTVNSFACLRHLCMYLLGCTENCLILTYKGHHGLLHYTPEDYTLEVFF